MNKITPGPWQVVTIVGVHHVEGPPILPYRNRPKICHPNNLGDAIAISALPDLIEICEDFVRKVESGEARSTKTYWKMKAALDKAYGR